MGKKEKNLLGVSVKIKKKKLADPGIVLEYLEFLLEFSLEIHNKQHLYPSDLKRINLELDKFAERYSKFKPDDPDLARKVRWLKVPKELVKEPTWKDYLSFLLPGNAQVFREEYWTEEITDRETISHLYHLIDNLKKLVEAYKEKEQVGVQ